MITPPCLSSCVFAFGERRILREEGDCADDDGNTAGGRLYKREAQHNRDKLIACLLGWIGMIELHFLAGPIKPAFWLSACVHLLWWTDR